MLFDLEKYFHSTGSKFQKQKLFLAIGSTHIMPSTLSSAQAQSSALSGTICTIAHMTQPSAGKPSSALWVCSGPSFIVFYKRTDIALPITTDCLAALRLSLFSHGFDPSCGPDHLTCSEVHNKN